MKRDSHASPFAHTFTITTLALSLQPKEGLVKLWAKREARELHLVFPRMQKNVRE
jgi:hypothetical protein